jgi:orotate phosphoribosyltransferase
MMTASKNVRQAIEACGDVVVEGHFVYASGRHGSHYFNKDAIFLHHEPLTEICNAMASAYRTARPTAVVGPAIGGAILAQLVVSRLHAFCHWTAASLGGTAAPDIIAAFAEKTAEGGYAFGRGYGRAIRRRRTLVVEDVLTSGETCRKVVEAAEAAGAEVVGVAAIVNRGKVTAKAVGSCRLVALATLDLASWAEDECPLCVSGVPVRTDLGKGREFLAKK